MNEIRKSDLTFLLNNPKLKQLIISGQGEQHLNIIKFMIEKYNKIEVEYYAPKFLIVRQLPSRQRRCTDIKTICGAGQFEVHMLIEPYYDGMPNQTKYQSEEQKLMTCLGVKIDL